LNAKTQETIAANSSTVLLLVLIAAIFWNIVAWLSWDSTFVMNDGIQYLSTATNWLQGQGFSTNALIYNPHFQGRLPAPQTVWPPGFPSLIVLASVVGISLETAVLVINLLSMALSGVLMYLILRRCGIQATFSIIGAALFYFTTTSWHLAVSLLSEPVFTCLILAALYCVPCSPRQSYRYWFICGLFIGACITVRYSGVFTAAAFGIGLSIVLLLHRCYSAYTFKQKFWRLSLLLAAPFVAFTVLMLRTQYLVGTINRNTGVGESKTLVKTMIRFVEEFSILIGFRDGWIFSGDFDTWFFLLFLLLLVVVCGLALLQFLREFQGSRKHRDHLPVPEGEGCYRATLVSVLIVHGAAFGGYLAWCSLSSSPLNITWRYLHQIYPSIFIVFCLVTSYALTHLTLTISLNTKILLRSASTCLVLLYMLGQLNMVPVIKEFAGPATDARDLTQLPVDNNKQIADIIRSCVGGRASPTDFPATSLWSNEGIPLHFNTGVHTITLTQIYTTSNFDFDQFESDISEYNVRLFVFVNSYDPLSDYGLMLSRIKTWLVENQYPKLQLPNSALPSGTSVDIFAVDSNCYK